MKHFKIIFSALTLALLMWSCNEELVYDVPEENTPEIESFSPEEGRHGTYLTIMGQYLSKVDSVSVGGAVATIKYRINDESMVVIVGAEAQSGAVEVRNSFGSAKATKDFTISYPVPGISKYPSTAKAYEKIIIEGENLDLVTAVHFDTTQAVVLAAFPELIEVEVPYFKSLTGKIALTYPTTDGEAALLTDEAFALDIVPPDFTDVPDGAFVDVEINIFGSELYLIDSVLFGDVPGEIVEQETDKLLVRVPRGFAATGTVSLSAKYSGNEIVLTDAFQVRVPTLAYWNEKIIYSDLKNGAANTTSAFFDAIDGMAYTPCDWEAEKHNVHFFVTVNKGKVRLTAQDNIGSHISKFSCNGTALGKEKTPNSMRLKRLNASNAKERTLIEQVKNKSLENLNNVVLNDLGIGDATQSYLEEEHMIFPFAQGDVILFQQYNEAMTEVKYTGALEIIELSKSADNTEASMKFNAYFGAY